MPFPLFDTVKGSTSFPPSNISPLYRNQRLQNPPRCFYFLQRVRRRQAVTHFDRGHYDCLCLFHPGASPAPVSPCFACAHSRDGWQSEAVLLEKGLIYSKAGSHRANGLISLSTPLGSTWCHQPQGRLFVEPRYGSLLWCPEEYGGRGWCAFDQWYLRDHMCVCALWAFSLITLILVIIYVCSALLYTLYIALVLQSPPTTAPFYLPPLIHPCWVAIWTHWRYVGLLLPVPPTLN